MAAMIGAKVVHKAFGEGVITGCADGYIRRFRRIPFDRGSGGAG